MNKDKNQFTSHLLELFLVYGVYFIIVGSLYPIFKKSINQYLFIGIILVVSVGVFYLWVRWNEKRIKNKLQARKWSFLLEKDDAEQKAIKDLFDVAKIRGLYDGVSLQDEIKEHFLKARKVKIKVTRGYNIFISDGTSSEKDIFHHCIYDYGKNQNRDIELLLHYPCLKNEHTKKRAKANNISEIRYMDSLFEVIKEIKEITKSSRNKNDISVRFYDDYEIKWRYYLFVAKNNNKTLFLNYYDDSKSGADSAMLKVEFGSGTLCQDFDRKFDKIFTDEKFSKEIISNVKSSSELISTGNCRHPECIEKIKELHSTF